MRSSPPAIKGGVGPRTQIPPIHLEEGRVFVQFGDDDRTDEAFWYLNTGTTNHITGSRVVFSDIDKNIIGTMRFGDGSIIIIEGRGTVLFSYKSGEHRKLTEGT